MNPQLKQSLTHMLTNQTDQGNSSVEVASSQVTLGCVKLAIKSNQENFLETFLHLRSRVGVSGPWNHSMFWGLEEVIHVPELTVPDNK